MESMDFDAVFQAYLLTLWVPDEDPHIDYCYRCGRYTGIDDTLKLCGKCITIWFAQIEWKD